MRDPFGIVSMLDELYPARCDACGAEEVGPLCPACRDVVGMKPFVELPPSLRDGWSVAPYAGSVGARVAKAKREGDREALRGAGRLLAEASVPLVRGDWFAAVVPAPSPWPRRLRRGFSPAQVLAARVARASHLPLWSVLQVAPGRRQSSLAAEQRRSNLTMRLSCRPLPPVRVLLVDDVVTSGTTLDRCARLLRCKGASGVWALALCDARRQRPDG